MPLTPLPSTYVCRSLDGQSSEAQSPVLRFIRRLILPLKYWSFTESVMATMHDIKFMVQIIYKCNACYVFDRAYFDLSRLYAIEQAGAFFIIREKFHPDYQITDGEDLLKGNDIILRDQIVRFTGKRNGKNYPIPLRRIIYFAPGFGRTFTYILPVTFTLKPKTPRMQFEYRYILQSSPIVWSQLLNTISNLVGQLTRLCVSQVIPYWSKTPFKSFWLLRIKHPTMTTITNCIWSSNLIHVFLIDNSEDFTFSYQKCSIPARPAGREAINPPSVQTTCYQHTPFIYKCISTKSLQYFFI